MHPRVVILSAHSLFSDGIASRLREHLAPSQLEVVDPRWPDAMNRIGVTQPAAVILDANDLEVTQLCPLNRLFRLVPELKVIRLDSQQQQVQVVTSELHPVGEVRDLLKVIEPCAAP